MSTLIKSIMCRKDRSQTKITKQKRRFTKEDILRITYRYINKRQKKFIIKLSNGNIQTKMSKQLSDHELKEMLEFAKKYKYNEVIVVE